MIVVQIDSRTNNATTDMRLIKNKKETRYVRKLQLRMQYVSCDEKGSVKSYTDEKGCVVSVHDYDEFGVDMMGTLNNEKPFGYCSFYYDTQMESYITPTRIYNPSIGRFDSRDKIDYIHVNNPASINLYTYCLNNPIMYVDYNGTDCYVYYLPEWEDEAVGDGIQLMHEYNLTEDQVHLVPIESNEDLRAAWNAMGTENGQTVDIDCVVLNTHASPDRISYGNGNYAFGLLDVSLLDEKDVGALIMYGCNSGHTDYTDSIAAAFSQKVNGAPVLASDGTVHSSGIFFHKYKSKGDKTFKEYVTGEEGFWNGVKNFFFYSGRDNQGWVVYQNGALVPDSSLGKKLSLSEMIEKLRSGGYICSLN